MSPSKYPCLSCPSDGEDADGTDDEEKRERVLTKIKVPSELDGRMKQNLFYFKQVIQQLDIRPSVRLSVRSFVRSSVLPITPNILLLNSLQEMARESKTYDELMLKRALAKFNWKIDDAVRYLKFGHKVCSVVQSE